MKLRVAVAQYEVPTKTKASIEKLKSISHRAAEQNIKLLVTPETSIGDKAQPPQPIIGIIEAQIGVDVQHAVGRQQVNGNVQGIQPKGL